LNIINEGNNENSDRKNLDHLEENIENSDQQKNGESEIEIEIKTEIKSEFVIAKDVTKFLEEANEANLEYLKVKN
jgi:hypothetical protein